MFDREQNYYRNRERHFLEVLLRFLKGKSAWKGTPSELADSLHNVADRPGVLPEGKGIGRELQSYAGAIEEAGWSFEFSRTKASRFIALRRVG